MVANGRGDACAMKPNPRRALLPQIRVTPDELAAIRKLASEAGQTVSDYVRSRALRKRISSTESDAGKR